MSGARMQLKTHHLISFCDVNEITDQAQVIRSSIMNQQNKRKKFKVNIKDRFIIDLLRELRVPSPLHPFLYKGTLNCSWCMEILFCF